MLWNWLNERVPYINNNNAIKWIRGGRLQSINFASNKTLFSKHFHNIVVEIEVIVEPTTYECSIRIQFPYFTY